jgi:hypothetical protein
MTFVVHVTGVSAVAADAFGLDFQLLLPDGRLIGSGATMLFTDNEAQVRAKLQARAHTLVAELTGTPPALSDRLVLVGALIT